MDVIFEAFNTFSGGHFAGKADNDFFDRLSSRYSLILLLLFAAIITFYQMTSTAIMCWFPVHFHPSHMKFANNYCWIKNTYWLPYDEQIPAEEEHDQREMIVYYQWVPFILLVQALLFFLPSLVWNAFNQKGGVDADNILAAAKQLTKIEQEENREGVIYLLVKQLSRFFASRRHDPELGGSPLKKCMTSLCHMCGRRFGSYLVTLFLFSKLLYIANVFFQLFMLNRLLGTQYNMYGFSVMSGLVESDHYWTESADVAFPRVTMCDFKIRRLGNLHRYAVQCTLPLNLFNEKIYVFLWFWFVFVLVMSILGFLQCFIRAVHAGDRVTFIQNHLNLSGRLLGETDMVMSDEFVREYLQQDGVFIIRLISHNTNNITTGEVTAALYDYWKEKCYKGRLEQTSSHNSIHKPPLDDEPSKEPLLLGAVTTDSHV